MTENQIQQAILREFGAVPYCRVWRQNVGLGYGYHIIRSVQRLFTAGNIPAANKLLASSRPVQYGVVGMADICGITSSGRFIGIEVKGESGRLRTEQKRWGEMIKKMGGIYVVARSVEDVYTAFRNERILQ